MWFGLITSSNMPGIRWFAGAMWSLDEPVANRRRVAVASTIFAVLLTVAWSIGALALAQVPKPGHGSDKYPVEIVPSVGGSTLHPMAVTPDGRFATIASGNRAELWDLEKARLVRRFTGLDSLAQSVDISPDGTRVAATDGDLILVWDIFTGRIVTSLRAKAYGIAFSADGDRITYVGWGEGAIIEIASGRTVRLSSGGPNRSFGAMAVSQDRNTIAYGDFEGTIRLLGSDGRPARDLAAHIGSITALSFSPNGHYLASSSRDAIAKIWEVASGRLLRTLPAPVGGVGESATVSWSVDGDALAIADGTGTLRLWNPHTRESGATRTFSDRWGKPSTVRAARHLPDGKLLLLAVNGLSLVDSGTLKTIRTIKADGLLSSMVANPTSDGESVSVPGPPRSILSVSLAEARVDGVAYGSKGNINMWSSVSVTGANDKRRYVGVDHQSPGSGFSTIVSESSHQPGSSKVLLRDLESAIMALSPDGRIGFAFAINEGAILFDAQRGGIIRKLSSYKDTPGNLTGYIHKAHFSPDGRLLVTVDLDNTVRIWDVASGRSLVHPRARNAKFLPDGNTFIATGTDRKYAIEVRSVRDGRLLQRMELPGANSIVNSVAVHPKGDLAAVSGFDGIVRLWNVRSGTLVREYRGHTEPIEDLAFAMDGNRIVSVASDGLKVWNTETGELLLTYFLANEADWVAMTPGGFFAASRPNAALTLSLVKGLEVHSIDQVFEHLYRPDLVEARLKGDPEGKYKDAAHKLNLQTVLDSGPAPQIDYLAERSDRVDDSVRLSVRITGRGGGVGSRVVWRVNGVTQGNPALASLESPLASVVVTETLKLVPGQVNVVEVTTYNRAGLVATSPLKISIDKFGATTTARPRMFVLALGVDKYRMKDYRLSYAAHDARTFTKAMELVGSGLFAEVETRILTDAEVNEAAISAAIDEIARAAGSEDVFVMFLGGHGKSIAGRYYYYPQTLDFTSGHSVERHAIGQDKWEAWLAKLVVQKSLLIIDTCEGDVFRGSRGTDSTRQAAMAQLQHATGRNIIAASRDAAYEGYRGHGVLTYAILEALDKKVSGESEDRVGMAALATHVGIRVPEISQKSFGIYQNPTRKLEGNDFPIGIRQVVLDVTGGGAAVPKEPTHVLIRAELVREKPAPDAQGSRTLAPGIQVRAVEFVGAWVIVARDGQRIGYVPTDALARMQ